MRSAIWGKFVKEILQEVKFRYDHSGIREELLEHMEELYEELRGNSLDWDRSNWNVSGLCWKMCVMDERGEQHTVEGVNGESISLGAGMFFRT